MTTDQRYLGGDYLQHNPTWHVEDSAWKAGQILRAIERNRLTPGSVCEVGSGAGEILNQLHAKLPESVRFTGYEIAPQAHELALTREKPRLTFRLADFLADESATYDLLLVMDVVEHVDDYLGFVRRLKGRAARTIFQVPMDFCAYTALRQEALMRGRRQMGHLHYFNRATALATIRDAGFEIVDDFYASASADRHNAGSGSPATRALRTLRRGAWRLGPDLSVKLLGGAGLIVVAR